MPARWTLPLMALLAGLLAGYLIGTQSPKATPDKPSGIPQSEQKNSKLPTPPTEDAKTEPLETWPMLKVPAKRGAAEAQVPLPLPRGNLEASYQLLEEEQNLVGIVDMILALIQQRRFPEADRLIENTLESLNGGKLNSPLWKNSLSPSFMILRFCQNAENMNCAMEYAVHLSQLVNPPELLGDLREEVLMGETAIDFLGLNDGHADHFIADLVPYYRERIENWNRTTWTNRSVIQSLGLIPTEESAILIADLKDWTSSNLKLELIQALANNGTPTAIMVMTEWLAEERNPRFKLAIEDALRLLGN